jgi:hypothetical protein
MNQGPYEYGGTWKHKTTQRTVRILTSIEDTSGLVVGFPEGTAFVVTACPLFGIDTIEVSTFTEWFEKVEATS